MKTKHNSLLLVICITIFLTASGLSCGKEDKTPAPDLSVGYTDAFTNKMSPKKMAGLKKAGATIYEGQDPPPLNGIYRSVEYISHDSDGKNIGETLTGFTDFQFTMDKVISNKSCLIDWTQWNDKDGSLIETSEGAGDTYFPMSGHGFNFSVAGFSQTTEASTGQVYTDFSCYSGQVTGDGISNWEFILYDVDQDDNITWIRIFKDTDGFCPREKVSGLKLSTRDLLKTIGKERIIGKYPLVHHQH